jgi:AraC-like DNA-binding protein
MSLLGKQPNRRYYAHLIALCFLLTVLPVLLLGILSYGKSSDVVRQKVNKEKILSLQQTQLGVEQTLKVADQAVSHFLGSKLLLSSLREPLGADQFQLFNQIRTELTNVQRLDTGISEIRVWSIPGNWYISNDGLFRLDAWRSKNPESLPEEPNQPSAWRINSNSKFGAGEAGNTDSCGTYVDLLKKLPLTSYESIGMAVVRIPSCQLSDLFTVNDALEPLYIFNPYSELIVKAGKTGPELDTALKERVAELPRQAAEPFELKTSGGSYAVNYRVSEYNDWIYISAVPLNELNRQSREIGWFTFYICVGLLLLFTVLALYGSGRLYRPIGRIVKDVLAAQPLSGREKPQNELSFIGEQVHLLFDTKRNLENRLSGQTELLRTFFMIKLYLGGMKKDDIAEQLQEYGMSRSYSSLRVLALQIGDLKETRFREKDRDLLLFAANNIIGELIPEDQRLQPVVLARTQLTVITGNTEKPEELEEELYKTAKHIVQTLTELLGLPVLVGISGAYSHATDIPRAHEEAVEALKRRPAFGGQAIMRFADLGENHSLRYAYPHELQDELFQAIKLLERDRAVLTLNRLLRHIGEAHPSPYDLQFHLVRLLMNLLGLANGIAKQAIPMQRQQSLFDELFQLDILMSGEGWFMDKLIDPLIEGMEEQTEVRHLAIAKEMVRMVQEEYDTDLTVESCADRLHYNADYAGTIFRKCMDMPFSAYLARHRHQVALGWLKETTMPIKDMAERLRYNNPQNFIRSFRKLEGLSPGKYRETYTEAVRSKSGTGGTNDDG